MTSTYQVHVVSWENGVDNYQTKIVTVNTEGEVRLMVFLASAFGLHSDYGVYGNDSNSTLELFKLWEKAKEKFPGECAELWRNRQPYPTYAQLEQFDEDQLDISARVFYYFIHDLLKKLLGRPSEAYWDEPDFIRYCEKIQVFFVPCPIEDVTNRFINPRS